MYIKLCKDSFFRQYGDFGYLVNRLSRNEKVYNETGAIFLSHIPKTVKSFDDIFNEIKSIFYDIDEPDLKDDFLSFVQELHEEKFLIFGKTKEETKIKEYSFSYKKQKENEGLAIMTSLDSFNEKEKLPDVTEHFNALGKKNPILLSLEFELTKRCNERCIHCYIPNSDKDLNVDIDKELIKKILKEARDIGTIDVTFSGGEPFLHKDIKEILRFAASLDLSINILSNALLITKETCHLLKEVDISNIQISLYSMNPEEHDFITKFKGSHKKTLNAIEMLIEHDIPVQISCPVMKANKNAYKDVAKYAYSKGVKSGVDFIIMAQSNLDTDNLANRLSLEEIEEHLKEQIQADERYKQHIQFLVDEQPETMIKPETPICAVGNKMLCVGADGNYYPCAGWQGYVIGNAKEKGLKEVWFNSEKLEFLRGITHASFPECLTCPDRLACSICLARNYNESGGDMFKNAEFFCKAAKLNNKVVNDYKAKLK